MVAEEDNKCVSKPAFLPGTGPLTKAQVRVMRSWLRPGATWRDVASDLEIQEGTVKVHLCEIYRRLGSRCKREAAARFVEFYSIIEPANVVQELAIAC